MADPPVFYPLDADRILRRAAEIMDPSGHVWTVATRVEETTPEERDERWSDILSEQDDS